MAVDSHQVTLDTLTAAIEELRQPIDTTDPRRAGRCLSVANDLAWLHGFLSVAEPGDMGPPGFPLPRRCPVAPSSSQEGSAVTDFHTGSVEHYSMTSGIKRHVFVPDNWPKGAEVTIVRGHAPDGLAAILDALPDGCELRRLGAVPPGYQWMNTAGRWVDAYETVAAPERTGLVVCRPKPKPAPQPRTEQVPWWEAVGRTLVSGDIISQVRRMAAVQHPGPYDLYVEMWSQNHECWCRPVLDDDGRVEVRQQVECAKCNDDATVPCECTPEVGDVVLVEDDPADTLSPSPEEGTP